MRTRLKHNLDLFIGCVYMHAQVNINPVRTDRFNLLNEDVRSLFVNNGSYVFLEGKSSELFPISQGVAQCKSPK